jgi:Ni/Co efflux regulator RcnB
MYKLFFSLLLFTFLTFSLNAEQNSSAKAVVNSEHNTSSSKSKPENNASVKKDRIKEQVKKQMEREKEYAQKQSFAQGDDYNLSAHEVDVNSLPDVPLIEPDYDFDITDVYRDDL